MRRNENTTGSRAEELRQRRSQENQQRTRAVNQRATATSQRANATSQRANATSQRPSASSRRAAPAPQRAAAPSPSSPVVVRNTTFGTPIHRQVATSNPRRTYYVALSSPGAELRLPAMPQLHPGWRLLSAAILVLAAVGLFSMVFSPFFQVYGATINGLERLSATDIEAVINVENLSIVEINPAEIEEQLLARYPALESVQVSVSMPTNIVLDVHERTPVLAWRHGDDVQWVDSQGVLFPPNGEVEGLVSISSPNAAPVVVQPAQEAPADGEAADSAESQGGAKLAKPVDLGPARLDPTLLETAQKLAASLPQGTPLVYMPSEGLGWEQPSGCDIFIGSDLSRFEVKLSAVKVIEENLDQQGVVAEFINARNLDAPYYRVEQ